MAASYRRAIVETVHQFSGWRPEPAQIDALKSEGCWNNDWQASFELLRRHGLAGGVLRADQLSGDRPLDDRQLDNGQLGNRPRDNGGRDNRSRGVAISATPVSGGQSSSTPLRGAPRRGAQPEADPLFHGHEPSGDQRHHSPAPSAAFNGDCGQPAIGSGTPEGLPAFDTMVAAFGAHYFGGDPEGDPALWRGFIGQEPLLVGPEFFADLSAAGFLWGFVSGAEPPSVRYVLQRRLGLQDPAVIAMGEAPDKPDPTGLLRLAAVLLASSGAAGSNPEPGTNPDRFNLGREAPPVVYLGDTVADVQTVLRARERVPGQRFLSLAVAPPHLHSPGQEQPRRAYEQQLRAAGADRILERSDQAGAALDALLG